METDDWRVVGVLGVCVVLAAVAVFWNEAHALLQNGADLPAWVQAFAAVVSACLTVALVWTTRKQAEIAEAQRVVMAGQLVSAQRTVEAMKDFAEHQLRAYVSVAGATMTGDPAFGVIRLENFGQTPAYDVRIWAGIWVGRHPLREDPPKSTTVIPDGQSYYRAAKLGKHANSTVTATTPGSHGDARDARGGRVLLRARYLQGYIRYRTNIELSLRS